MINYRIYSALRGLAFVVVLLLLGCQEQKQSVVIYTSVDQNYSEWVLSEFEERTGIRVLPVYDLEASKTTGLANRLIEEKSHPQADVFWNGEFSQTILLKEEGVLVPYHPVNAADIPAQYKDPDGYWTGFAGRARVLLVNTNLVSPENYPDSIFDLLKSDWPAKQKGIAYPLFGTTLTHAAAIYATLGPDKGRAFFKKLHTQGIRTLSGNSIVRDLVANGQLAIGLTDTDDAYGALERGAPVKIIFPDQNEDSIGTLIVPNTVALIANAPHPNEARMFIDFLVSKEAELNLTGAGWCHIPFRSLASQWLTRNKDIDIEGIKAMDVKLEEVSRQLPQVKQELSEIFLW